MHAVNCALSAKKHKTFSIPGFGNTRAEWVRRRLPPGFSIGARKISVVCVLIFSLSFFNNTTHEAIASGHSYSEAQRPRIILMQTNSGERSRASPCLPSLNSALDRCAPLLGWRSVAEFVVPLPPLVRRGLRVALGRVLPFLLATERGNVEIVPRAPHLLVAAAVNEVR